MKKLLLPLLLLAAACSPSETRATETESEEGGPLVVYTVNYPLAYFAEWIGGDAVRVELPAPPDEDPAFWSPAPETIVAYQGADLILLNGAGYAKWVERASLPASRIVDTSAAQTERLVAVEEVSHTHGPEGDHTHGAKAFTTWLDPTFAVEQARAIAAALSSARPGLEEDFATRFAALRAELLELDERWRAVVAADPDRPLLGSHPVYQYLDERCGLNLVSLHWEPDEMPDEGMWGELETLLESHPAKWMLWEGEPLPAIAARLNGLGVESIVFDPCGKAPQDGRDFLDVMRSNSEALDSVF
jgi:zinc transport system substrate-binding protein